VELEVLELEATESGRRTAITPWGVPADSRRAPVCASTSAGVPFAAADLADSGTSLGQFDVAAGDAFCIAGAIPKLE